MATYQMDCRCPQCGFSEAIENGDTRTDISQIFCPRCGHWREIDCDSREVRMQRHGQGAYLLTKRGYGLHGAFRHPGTLSERIRKMRKAIQSRRCLYVEVTHRVRGRWQKVVLKNIPKPWRPKVPVKVHQGDLSIPW